MSKILVSGSLAYDRIMDFPGLFKEHIVADKVHALSVSFLIDKLSEGFGGTAGNIAYNLALLGEEAEYLATAGNDFEKYRAWLVQHGINTDSIQVAPDLASAGAYVITDKGGNQITAFYPGAMTVRYSKNFGVDAKLALVSPGNMTDMIELPKKFREAGIKYFFDAGQQITALSSEMLREAIPGAAALFGNDYKMSLMMDKLGWTREELLQKVPVVVTTLGEKGSRIETPDATHIVAGVKSNNVVDPTGAGDSYRAGFAKGFLNGLSLRQCAQLGSVVAVYVVEKYGTQNHTFTTDELRRRHTQAYGEALSL